MAFIGLVMSLGFTERSCQGLVSRVFGGVGRSQNQGQVLKVALDSWKSSEGAEDESGSFRRKSQAKAQRASE